MELKLHFNKAKIWQVLISFTNLTTYLQSQQEENDRVLEAVSQKDFKASQVLMVVYPTISKIKHLFNLWAQKQ